jgi:hypothetical protein
VSRKTVSGRSDKTYWWLARNPEMATRPTIACLAAISGRATGSNGEVEPI